MDIKPVYEMNNPTDLANYDRLSTSEMRAKVALAEKWVMDSFDKCVNVSDDARINF